MKTVFVVNGIVTGHVFVPDGRADVSAASTDASAAAYQVTDNSPVDAGWTCVVTDGQPVFTAPSPVPPKIGPIAFQMLFTTAERVAAKSLRATDAELASFWDLIDDPRTDVVDLSLQTVQGAVEYTLTVVKASGVDVDVPTRKAQILTGVVQ